RSCLAVSPRGERGAHRLAHSQSLGARRPIPYERRQEFCAPPQRLALAPLAAGPLACYKAQNPASIAAARASPCLAVCLTGRHRRIRSATNSNRLALPVEVYSGKQMASPNTYAPTREDFAALLEESYGESEAIEGSVIKGKVVGIEKDVAVIDLGLKTEGRVPLKEFSAAGREGAVKIGDEVEVYLERIENALGEAVISRDKARREESWVKLAKAFENQEKVEGIIFNQVKGGFTVDLDGAVAFLPRSQVD